MIACGTRSAYQNKGCRCVACTTANAVYQKAWRDSKRGEPIPAFVYHGKVSTYLNWSCRCAPCTKAARRVAS